MRSLETALRSVSFSIHLGRRYMRRCHRHRILVAQTKAAPRFGFRPNPWLVGLVALAAGSLFLVVPKAWGWRAVGIYLLLDLIVIVGFGRWSRRVGWNECHRLALAGGAALAYAWHAFIENPAAGLAVALMILLAAAARRIAHSLRGTSAATVSG